MTWEQPPVSIVMPCYNSIDTLRESLDSALALDYPDFEVVVVDDCSTDGSYEIVQRYAKDSPLIRLFRLEQNSGVQAARDFGARQARHEWIASTDSDAVLPKDWLKRASRHFAEADMVGGSFRAAPGSFIEKSLNVYYLKSSPGLLAFPPASTRFDPPAGGYNVLFKGTVFHAVGGYDREVRAAEDILLVARGIEKGFTYFFDCDMYVCHPFNPRCQTVREFCRRFWQLHKWRKVAAQKSRLIRNRNVLTCAGGIAVLLPLVLSLLCLGPAYGVLAYLGLLAAGAALQGTKLRVATRQPFALCLCAVALKFLRRVIAALALATPGQPTATGWSRRF